MLDYICVELQHMKKTITGDLAIILVIIFTFLPSLATGSDLFSAISGKSDDKSESLDIFSQLAKTDAPMADYASFQLIQDAFSNEDFNNVNNLCQEHLKRFPNSRHMPEVLLIYAESLCVTDNYLEAQKQLEFFLKKYSDTQETRAMTLLGNAYYGQKNVEKAQRALGESIYLWGYRQWKKHAKKLSDRIYKETGSDLIVPKEENFVNAIEEAWKKRHFYTCRKLCNTFADLYPGNESWRYRLKAIDCLLERRKRKDARSELKRIEKSIPKTRKATAALLLRWARAERGRGFKGKPHTSYHEIARLYPETEGGLHALYLMGEIDFYNYDFSSAAKRLEKVLEHRKFKKSRDEAFWHAGFSRYLLAEYEKAVGHFNQYLVEYPDHKDRDRIIYWRGRSFDLLKQPKASKDNYQWLVDNYFGTYYGLAAQVWLETWGAPDFSGTEIVMESLPWVHLLPILPIIRLDPNWAQKSGGGSEIDEGATRALEFFSVYGDARIRLLVSNFYYLIKEGQGELALEEAAFLYKHYSNLPYVKYLSGMMQALCGRNLKSVLIANETAKDIRGGDLFDPHRINARRQFPLLFFDLIQKTAEKYELDPFFLIALVKQESAFQVEAKSWAGARGLFQIMPKTGKWIAYKRGIKRFKTSDLYDLEKSADFGTWYIVRLLDNYENDVPKSLVGYNAGGLRADRWWGANAHRKVDEMIELIGFTETRNYVKIILRNWEMYKRLYQDTQSLTTDRDTIFLRLMDEVPEITERKDTD